MSPHAVELIVKYKGEQSVVIERAVQHVILSHVFSCNELPIVDRDLKIRLNDVRRFYERGTGHVLVFTIKHKSDSRLALAFASALIGKLVDAITVYGNSHSFEFAINTNPSKW